MFDTLLKDYTPVTNNSDSSKEKNEPSKESSDKKGCDNEEVLAVLGHELGHWKLNHVLKNIVIMQVYLTWSILYFIRFILILKYIST